MNLKENLVKYKDLIKKKKWIFIGAVSFLLVAIAVIALVVNNKSKNQIADVPTVIENSGETENGQDVTQSGETVQENETEVSDDVQGIERYQSLCQSYNAEIDKYNEEIDKYSAAIDTLTKKGILNLPEKKAEKEYIKEDFDSFNAAGLNFTGLEGDIVKLTVETAILSEERYNLFLDAVNGKIADYNLVVNEYNDLLKLVSVDFVSDISEYHNRIELNGENIQRSYWTEEKLSKYIDTITKDTEGVIPDYLMMKQICNPSVDWVRERIKSIDNVTGTVSTSTLYDPNGLMGTKGGYTGCLYFSISGIDQDVIPGNSLIDKGTDAGGAIEIFANKEDALKRCDYLSQFDGTILYSGSYAIIGTMVIRTSYILSADDQIKLTDTITKKLTEVKADAQ